MSYTNNPLYQLTPPRVNGLLERFKQRIWKKKSDLDVYGGPLNEGYIDLYSAQKQTFNTVVPGEIFAGPGSTWQQRWFRLDIPKADSEELGRRYLFWVSGGETTVYYNGNPWAGLDIAHRYCLLPDEACTLWLDTGTYQSGIWYRVPEMELDRFGCRFDGACISLRDEKRWETYWDVHCLAELMKHHLTEEGWVERRLGLREPLYSAPPVLRLLLHELEKACDLYENEGLGPFADYIKKIYEKLPAAAWQGFASIIGHAHIDLVWLWPENVGRRKHIHTFSTVLRLMEKYPEFRFIHSQPLAYNHVKESEPALFKQVRQRIEEKRWEPTGGFVVECDVNIPCGEALVRELVYGQRQFAELRNGELSSTVWVPDVFGYSNCLPQLMAQAGISSFFTTKIIWSNITRFPHNAFRWKGADGSEIVTFLCPVGYNETVELNSIIEALSQQTQSGIHPDALLPVGFGDGGGGPTPEMCERARRYRNLSTVPRTRWARAEDFFEELLKKKENLPAFEGELYLELHRGTYTSQAQMKEYYRKSEKSLQAREAVRVLGERGPIDWSDWLRVCLAQFHDALPGSSIGIVYEELVPELKEIGERQLSHARKELEEVQGTSESVLSVFNPVLIPRRGVITLTEEEYSALGGSAHKDTQTPSSTVQKVPAGGTDAAKKYCVPVCASGLETVSLASPFPLENPSTATGTVLDNGLVRTQFNDEGRLSALTIDEEEVLLRAPAGFKLYPDYPADWDAWDIDRHTLAMGSECCREIDLQINESGPVRASLSGKTSLGDNSSLTVTYSLEADSPYLFIEMDVEWRESHKLLKYLFPTDYHGRTARYGCPFGSIYRPQKTGFPNEESQWEVPGSRWAAVSDDKESRGLAVITESKYGFSCRDGELGVSLLRAPSHPDPNADRGKHTIRFAVGLHRIHTVAGRLSTAAAAESLYAPLLLTKAKTSRKPPVALKNGGSLVPAWILPAETKEGYTIRLHETSGDRGSAILSFDRAPQAITLVDFLERENAAVNGGLKKLDDTTYELSYKPYKIISVLVER